MKAQYLEYVRQTLLIATADLSGCTKGQLTAFAEDAQYCTGRYRRKKMKVEDPETGELVTVDAPPVPGKQSRAKGEAIALIQPVEYATSSWRRAIHALDDHHKAWLLWCYSEDADYDHQVVITTWGWEVFQERIVDKKVSKKVMDRLKALLWLCAQDVKAEILGMNVYQSQKLASLVGVCKSTWSEGYSFFWESMRCYFLLLDREALKAVSQKRECQRWVFSAYEKRGF